MGKHDSSLTRVAPLFGELRRRDPTGQSWLPILLRLPRLDGRSAPSLPASTAPLVESLWGSPEKALAAPPTLLAWLAQNLQAPRRASAYRDGETRQKREKLVAGDLETVQEALRLLSASGASAESSRVWYVLEGVTRPDVYLATPDVIVVIEGKRTESKPTTVTEWMRNRHQMLRHLDAAWEVRGERPVYGFFIVEGPGGADAIDVSDQWRDFTTATVSQKAIEDSLPHRSPEERAAIAASFLGVTTWQAACRALDLDWSIMLDEAPAKAPRVRSMHEM